MALMGHHRYHLIAISQALIIEMQMLPTKPGNLIIKRKIWVGLTESHSAQANLECPRNGGSSDVILMWKFVKILMEGFDIINFKVIEEYDPVFRKPHFKFQDS